MVIPRGFAFTHTPTVVIVVIQIWSFFRKNNSSYSVNDNSKLIIVGMANKARLHTQGALIKFHCFVRRGTFVDAEDRTCSTMTR